MCRSMPAQVLLQIHGRYGIDADAEGRRGASLTARGRVPGRGVADHGPSLLLWSRPVHAAASRRAITADPGRGSLKRASNDGDSGRDLEIPSA